MKKRFQVPLLCMAFVAFDLAIVPVEAAPRRFTYWAHGHIADIDATRETLTVREDAGSKIDVFTWNGETRLWDRESDPKSDGRSVAAKALAKGEAVRVMFAKDGKRRVAKRIIVLSSAE